MTKRFKKNNFQTLRTADYDSRSEIMQLHVGSELNYLREPRANTAFGIFEIRKMVSMMQRTMSSWLNALFILGFCRRKIAKEFPKVPKLIITELTTPEIQNFHSSRCCNRKNNGSETIEIRTIDIGTIDFWANLDRRKN